MFSGTGRFASRSPPRPRRAGSGRHRFFRACWYRRDVRAPRARDRANGCCCTSARSTTRRRSGSTASSPARHEGGYTPFTRRHHRRCSRRRRPQTIVVRAEDDPHDLAKPRGKQDWQLEPHSIWYPRTTGIWQTVWLERVPATCDRAASAGRRTSSAGRSASRPGSTASAATACGCDVKLRARRHAARRRHATRSSPARCTAGSRCPIPGIDDYRNELLWSPERADADRRRARAAGRARRACSTRSRSYTALRVDRRAGRPLRAQRPALPAAAGARPGLLARHAA